MMPSSSYAFDAFSDRRPFLVKDLASAVRALHPDVLHIELDCFLTQTTFIPCHLDSSSTGDSTGSPLRILSAVTPEGVVGRYAPPAKILPHFEHSQILVLVRCTAFLPHFGHAWRSFCWPSTSRTMVRDFTPYRSAKRPDVPTFLVRFDILFPCTLVKFLPYFLPVIKSSFYNFLYLLL
jgi:hypothetical protein